MYVWQTLEDVCPCKEGKAVLVAFRKLRLGKLGKSVTCGVLKYMYLQCTFNVLSHYGGSVHVSVPSVSSQVKLPFPRIFPLIGIQLPLESPWKYNIIYERRHEIRHTQTRTRKHAHANKYTRPYLNHHIILYLHSIGHCTVTWVSPGGRGELETFQTILG